MRFLNKIVPTLKLARNHSDVKNRIVLVDGVRTPFCRSNTVYSEFDSYHLASFALSGLLDRTKIDPKIIDYVCMGTVIQDVKTTNVARESLLIANFPTGIPAHTVTMACISSNQAVTSGIGMILSGAAEVVVCGGVETMSDPPIKISKGLRSAALKSSKAKSPLDFLSILMGVKLKDISLEIPSVSEFSSNETMGTSTDRLTSAFNVSREEQDAFAIRSQKNADLATKTALLTDIIQVMSTKGIIKSDNTIRVSTTEDMKKLKPVFVKNYGSVTAGNSSPLTDGASACLIMTEKKALELKLTPKAILKEFLYTGQDPIDQLLIGPAYAIPKLLKKVNLGWKDIGVVELHEPFAGQVLSVLKAMDSDYFCKNYIGLENAFGSIPMEILNNWGGSLSLGHPFGATGVRLLTMAANRLQHEAKNNPNAPKYAVISGCAAGGLAHSMLIERY